MEEAEPIDFEAVRRVEERWFTPTRTREEKLQRYGEGPWIDESDELEGWHMGLRFLVLRMPGTGVLNGYVEIPPQHPWSVRPEFTRAQIVIHGGLTYARHEYPGFGKALRKTRALWVGFDTGHAGDLQPGLASAIQIFRDFGYTYKDLNWVAERCRVLAEKIAVEPGWRARRKALPQARTRRQRKQLDVKLALAQRRRRMSKLEVDRLALFLRDIMAIEDDGPMRVAQSH